MAGWGVHIDRNSGSVVNLRGPVITQCIYYCHWAGSTRSTSSTAELSATYYTLEWIRIQPRDPSAHQMYNILENHSS